MSAAIRSRYLLDLLAQAPDPRKRRGRRHCLARLLAVGIAAVIAGSRSFAAVGQWAADAGADVLAALGADRGPAEESTFRRAYALVSADVLDRVLGAWLWTRAGPPGPAAGWSSPSTACGFRSNSRQIRPTADFDSPDRRAIEA